MPKKAILIASGPWDPKVWAAAAKAADPERPMFIWPKATSPQLIRYALVWQPPDGVFARLANLEVIFSLGAGVDDLVFRNDLPDVPIVRMANQDLTRRMTEWVTLQVLIHHRRQRNYDRLQAARTWKQLPQPAAGDVRVGIMGLGVIGRDVAEVLVRLGFSVAGWSRGPRSATGVEAFSGPRGLDPFLRRTDILVALLPLTRDTRGILTMRLFAKLAPDGVLGGPVVINAGRGGLQVETDLVKALSDGVLIGASLDVFEAEPLPASSPLWKMPNVVITPHVAGWSSPAVLTAAIVKQIKDYEAGQPLRNLVDRAAMY